GRYGASAFGMGTLASGSSGTALGVFAEAAGGESLAAGSAAFANGGTSVALGARSVAWADNSVALGAGSRAIDANTVAVGWVGAERQIVHVAAGTNATDAVNLAQFQSAIAALNQRLGKEGGGSVAADGQDTVPAGDS